MSRAECKPLACSPSRCITGRRPTQSGCSKRVSDEDWRHKGSDDVTTLGRTWGGSICSCISELTSAVTCSRLLAVVGF